MDTVRRVISASNKRRKRIWKAIKKKCTCFNFRRRNRPSNSTSECTVEINGVEAEMIMLDEESKDKKTKFNEREEDTQISASVISTTKEGKEPTIGDIEKQQLRSDSELSEEKTSHHRTSNDRESEDNRTSYNSVHIPHMSINDFKILNVLGKGNYGEVKLCRHKQSNDYFAMKILNKNNIIDHNHFEYVFTEKRIFILANNVRHPFLVNLVACFQTDTHLSFVMEYTAGGDLGRHISNEVFTESRTVFYSACIILGLKYLHQNCVIHRDLKLANILMDVDGYVKIGDYGMCKDGIKFGDRISAKCGTPAYMAPEMLKMIPYSHSVDWWALGIIIYQMLVGELPFWGENLEELYDAVLNDNIKYPRSLSVEAFVIIKKLLCKDPDRRLGSNIRNAEDVEKQKFFSKIVWNDLSKKKIEPPWVPIVIPKEYLDDSYEELTSKESQITPRKDIRLLSQHEQQSSKDSNVNDFQQPLTYDEFVMKLFEYDSETDEKSTSKGSQLKQSNNTRIISNEEQQLFKNFSYTADWFQQTR